MATHEMAFTDHFDRFCDGLRSGGLLLVSLDAGGRPNVMTIGWAQLGVVWGRPICTVLVRPSRYTYGCMEATGDFTVCVPGEELSDDVVFCGTRSGRDYDKLAECGFTPTKSMHVKSPGIAQCEAIYECRIVQRNDVVPENLLPEIDQSAYASGDYHRVYFGEVLASYRME